MLGRRVNSHRLGSATPYHPVNSLMVARAELRMEGKRIFNPILSNNQWLVESIDFRNMTMYHLRCTIVGQGTGYLYASFKGDEGQELLTIEKVTAGTHELKFRCPFNALANFKIGVSNTVPQGTGVNYLPREMRYRLQTNSLLFNQSKPQYESGGLGFGGLGAALLDINQPIKAGDYRDDNNYKHWDGNLNNYTWDNGYRGPKEDRVTTNNISQIGGSYHGYYANATNLHIARFDDNDNFIGWDALESYVSGVPAGVPLCATFQFFVLNSKGEDEGNKLAWKAKEPYWIYAQDYQIPAGDIHFVEKDWLAVADRFVPLKEMKGSQEILYSPRWAKKSPIGIGNDPERIRRTALFGDVNWGNFSSKLRNVAAKVEWYDEVTNTWSSPQVAPNSIPMTNEMGLTKIIFRFPRQLDEVTDKDILTELTTLGVDYSYAATKKNYPYKLNVGTEIKKAYTVLGRPNPNKDSLTYEENGDTYVVTKVVTSFGLYFKYGKHPKAGRLTPRIVNDELYQHDGAPKDGHVQALGVNELAVADAEKFARLNTPEIISAFYPAGGFTTGGIVAGIGRGFTLGGRYALSTRPNEPLWGRDEGVNKESYPTGEKIGTKAMSRIYMTGLIQSTDLVDDRMAVTEEKLQALWKAKFDEPLTDRFFEGNDLPDQDPNNKMNYLIRDPETGLKISAPYQIFYFKLGEEYEGPYYEYESVTEIEKVKVDGVDREAEVISLKITKNPNKDFSMVQNQFIYLCARTPLGYTRSQKFDIIKQVDEQRTLIEAGLTPSETLALDEAEYPTVDTTATTDAEMRERNALIDLTGEEPPEVDDGPKYGSKKVKWPWEMLKKNPKYYNMEVISGFNGFTNDRDFYVEDVTQKWGQISGLGSKPRDHNTDYTDIMPATNPPKSGNYTGLGNVLDAFIDYDPAEFATDNLEDIGDVLQDAVYATAYGTGALLELPVAAAQAASGDFTGSAKSAKSSVRKAGTAGRNALSFPLSTADLAIKLSDRVTRVGTTVAYKGGQAAVEYGSDLVDAMAEYADLGGMRAASLGAADESTADKLERYGENTTSFFKGAAKGLTPDVVQDSFGDAVGTLTDKFNERPVLYTGLALAGVPLLIPGIGGAYARNIATGIGALVGGLPKAGKALAELPGALIGGTVQGVRSAAGSPRGTAAARRRARRRKR